MPTTLTIRLGIATERLTVGAPPLLKPMTGVTVCYGSASQLLTADS
jgi:hypothetical protein